MYEQSHDEAQHIRQQLHALVIGQLCRLINFTDDVCEDVAQLLIVHQ